VRRQQQRQQQGQYQLFAPIGEGGMAQVFLARLVGAGGFARTVAVKRPLPELQLDASFLQLAHREAQLASRLNHPNVVSTLDVIDQGDELLIVMEYVHGVSLSKLMQLQARCGGRMPQPVALALLVDALAGLHAAHTAIDEQGVPLHIVHRDVSPQNILCGADGHARLSDFGLAHARDLSSSDSTRFMGKITYASPEQVHLKPVTAATDIFSMGMVLWEVLSGTRAYQGLAPAQIIARLSGPDPVAMARLPSGVPQALMDVVERALRPDPKQRFPSALEMSQALEAAAEVGTARSVADWVSGIACEALESRAQLVSEAERETAAASNITLGMSTIASRLPPRAQRGIPRLNAALGLLVGVALVAALSTLLPPPSSRATSPAPVELALTPRDSHPEETSQTRLTTPEAAPAPTLPRPRAVAAQGLPTTGPALAPIPMGREVAARPSLGGGPRDEARLSALVGYPRARNGGRLPSTRAIRRASRAERRARPEVASSQSVSASTPRCSPPFSLDSRGIRHMKPGCE
jgi:eukaryotic-like serine/threonine-protein kinase